MCSVDAIQKRSARSPDRLILSLLTRGATIPHPVAPRISKGTQAVLQNQISRSAIKCANFATLDLNPTGK
jgi:hypothetical protein